MDDPREKFVRSVSLVNSSVIPFDGFIFLCGGLVDAASALPTSVRDALVREMVKDRDFADRYRLAEDYKDWSFEGHYTDLLEFEDHIAQLAAAIVLVLESPGSLTELGLFSALDHFRDKLIVVISNYHYAQNSFIRLGPVKYLEDSLENAAECFPWIRLDLGHEIFDATLVASMSKEMCDAVTARVRPISVEAKFNEAKWLHVALLICELVGLMSALTLTEIKGYLQELGIERTLGQVKKTVFLLEMLGMLSGAQRSSQRFYISKLDRDFIRWSGDRESTDRGRLRFNVINFYESSDKRRFRALQDARGA